MKWALRVLKSMAKRRTKAVFSFAQERGRNTLQLFSMTSDVRSDWSIGNALDEIGGSGLWSKHTPYPDADLLLVHSGGRML